MEALEFDYFDDLWFLLPMLVCVSECVLTVESEWNFAVVLLFGGLWPYGSFSFYFFFFIPLI